VKTTIGQASDLADEYLAFVERLLWLLIGSLVSLLIVLFLRWLLGGD
jgi:hypothetical protein